MKHTMRRWRRVFWCKVITFHCIPRTLQQQCINYKRKCSKQHVQSSWVKNTLPIHNITADHKGNKWSVGKAFTHYHALHTFSINIKFTSFKTCCTYYGQDCPWSLSTCLTRLLLCLVRWGQYGHWSCGSFPHSSLRCDIKFFFHR